MQQTDSGPSVMPVHSITPCSPLESLNAQRVLHNEFDARSSSRAMAQSCRPESYDTLMVDKVDTLVEGLHDTASVLTEMLKKNPVVFSDLVASFLKQFQVLKTESAVVSALKTFGKYTGVALSLSEIKKNKQLKRKGTQIKVQPAAISRRTTVLGGRRCLHTGRKVRDACQVKKPPLTTSNSQLMPKKRPRRAPHSFGQCVANKENIEKNKSSKW